MYVYGTQYAMIMLSEGFVSLTMAYVYLPVFYSLQITSSYQVYTRLVLFITLICVYYTRCVCVCVRVRVALYVGIILISYTLKWYTLHIYICAPAITRPRKEFEYCWPLPAYTDGYIFLRKQNTDSL